MTELVRYEAARSALTAAVSVDEVRNIHDVSRAMAYYARQAKDSDLIDKATELRLRAERRLGEMIVAQKETTGLNQGAAGGGKKASSRGTLVEPRDTRPTLASAGIDEKLSARAQKIAALPELAFEERLNAAKKQAADALRLTTAEKQQRRAEREADLAAKQHALPDERFGVIYADPPWRFEVYSRDTGLDRDASNHYPVQALEQIEALDVPSIAADDCVLFLWATVPTLMQAGEVMAAWGFVYKSCVTWAKDRAGKKDTGFATRPSTYSLGREAAFPGLRRGSSGRR
jgi:hypothetical protein